MKVSVIGGGHGCYAAAIEMVEKGFDVTLWRRDGNALQELRQLGYLSRMRRANGVFILALTRINYL